jgi:hypothetical protein
MNGRQGTSSGADFGVFACNGSSTMMRVLLPGAVAEGLEFQQCGSQPLCNPIVEFVGKQFSIPFLRIQALVQRPLFLLQQVPRPPDLGFRCLQDRKPAVHRPHFGD